jgi:hypothetical protein
VMGRRYITPKGQHIPGGYDDTPRASVRYGSNPDNAVMIYDPIIGRLRMITPDELAQLTRKAEQYDEMVDMAVDVKGRGYIRFELASDGAITWGVVECDGE